MIEFIIFHFFGKKVTVSHSSFPPCNFIYFSFRFMAFLYSSTGKFCCFLTNPFVMIIFSLAEKI